MLAAGPGLWNLLPPYIRAIGGDTTQSVYPTARDLYDMSESYAPKNLAEYLNGPGARIYGEDGN